jgi:O-antigen/teichoic acid export membrane protein
MLPLYTRKLSTAEYGTVDLLVTTISLLIPILTLSIASATLRFGMEKNSNKKYIFTYSFGIILAGAVLLAIGAAVVFAIIDISEDTLLIYRSLCCQRCRPFFSLCFAKVINQIKIVGIVGIIKTAVMIGANLDFIAGFLTRVLTVIFWPRLFLYYIVVTLFFSWMKLYKYFTRYKRDKELNKTT